MSLEPVQQFFADFVLGFVGSVFSPWKWARIIACLVIPFAVALIAMGPGIFSGSIADGGGLIYTFFLYFAFLGVIASGLGGLLGYLVRRVLKLKT